jgi:hypothetical protein
MEEEIKCGFSFLTHRIGNMRSEDDSYDEILWKVLRYHVEDGWYDEGVGGERRKRKKVK